MILIRIVAVHDTNNITSGKVIIKSGNYDNVISITNVRGYWRPLEGSNPFIG